MFCPKCGAENFDTNKFCRKCGRQMPLRADIRQAVHQTTGAGTFAGQVLDGKYRIEAKLGSGGMGDVYRATRLLIGDTVAVKILHPHLAREPQAAERFRREAVMATKLRHRNVVAIYDVGISGAHNVPYILMELAEGYTLRQIINQYRVLPLDFAVTVTTQVCAALGEAHGLGIIHRDIKPENIIANETTTGWYVKVLDFGIAKLSNQADIGLTQDGTSMGTPQYMSPEQCLGEALDARSDVYSAGIMLYEMLTGTVPFKSATASAIAVHQVQTTPQAPRLVNDEIHPQVEAVVLKSIWKQREHRQQNAAELSRELIEAATVAFRSGFTAVPSAPVLAPDVEPEFDGEAEDQPMAEPIAAPPKKKRKPQKKPEPVSDELLATIPIIDPSVTDAGSRPWDTPPQGEPTAVLDTVKPSDMQGEPTAVLNIVQPPETQSEPTVVLNTITPPDTQAETVVLEKEMAASATAAAETYSQPDPIESTPPVIQTLPSDVDIFLPADVGTETAPDLKLVFEDAEQRLDEILREPTTEPRGAVSAKTVELTADEIPQITTVPATTQHVLDDDALPSFAQTVETGGRNKTLLVVLVGAGAFVLLIGIVSLIAGAAYFFSRSEVPANQAAASNSAEPTTITPTAPTGMAFIPGGEFMMGDDKGDEYSRPAHAVTVQPFFMNITEVTNEDYKKFVDAAPHTPPPTWKNGTFPAEQTRFPVTGVTWDDANAYAKWAGKRLPTEAEWEFAARGTDGRIYPWGQTWDRKHANAAGVTRWMREVGKGDGMSPFGILDMAGNAWEWTASEARAYPGGKDFAKRQNPKVIRGGFWGSSKDEATTVFRRAYGAVAESDYGNTGFRCVKDQ